MVREFTLQQLTVASELDLSLWGSKILDSYLLEILESRISHTSPSGVEKGDQLYGHMPPPCILSVKKSKWLWSVAKPWRKAEVEHVSISPGDKGAIGKCEFVLFQ